MAQRGELLPGDLVFVTKRETYANLRTCPPKKWTMFRLPVGSLGIVVSPDEELKFEGAQKGIWHLLALWSTGTVGYVEHCEVNKA